MKSINSDNSINSPTAYNDISNVPLDYGGEWLYSYNAMENFMLSNGYLDVIEEKYNDFDAYLDSWNAQFYLQSNKGESARLLSNEEANELRVSVWDEYLKFREEELQRDDSQSVGSKLLFRYCTYDMRLVCNARNFLILSVFTIRCC